MPYRNPLGTTVPIEKTIQRIENIGFCKEDYDVMESHFPGIFKDINRAQLTVIRSNTKRDVAIEAIDLTTVLKVGGAVIAAGGVALLMKKLLEWLSSRFGGGGSGGGGGGSTMSEASSALSDAQRSYKSNARTAEKSSATLSKAIKSTSIPRADVVDHLMGAIQETTNSLNSNSYTSKPKPVVVSSLEIAHKAALQNADATKTMAAGILFKYCKRFDVPSTTYTHVLREFDAASYIDDTLRMVFLLPNAVSATCISSLADTIDDAAKDYSKLASAFQNAVRGIKKISEGDQTFARGKVKGELNSIQNYIGGNTKSGSNNNFTGLNHGGSTKTQVMSLASLDPANPNNELEMHTGFVSYWAGMDAPNGRPQYSPAKDYKKVDKFLNNYKPNPTTLKLFDDTDKVMFAALSVLNSIDFEQMEKEADGLARDGDWNLVEISNSIKRAGILLNKLNTAGHEFMRKLNHTVGNADAVTVSAIKIGRAGERALKG